MLIDSTVDLDRRFPAWAPRMWYGMRLLPWLRLVTANRLAIRPGRLPMVLAITLAAAGNSVAAALQEALYGGRIRRTAIEPPPVFVIGHWRSGTTLMHELLALDPRNVAPTTYQCFAPEHFLLTGHLVPRLLGPIMPRRRPMDAMPMGWHCAQEDEFALCVMGLPSFYTAIGFPNTAFASPEDIRSCLFPGGGVERWKRGLTRFLQRVSLARHGRLILKSPLHTGRLDVLSQLFPGARFVHLVRDPYDLYASTVKMWTALTHLHGFQRPAASLIEDRVFGVLNEMYARFDEQRSRIGQAALCTIRLEDLVHDPLQHLRRAYDELDLAGFDELQPRAERYLAGLEATPCARYELPVETRRRITRTWGHYARRFGYPLRE